MRYPTNNSIEMHLITPSSKLIIILATLLLHTDCTLFLCQATIGDNLLVKSCKQGLDFVSINDFRSFIEQYKSKQLEELQQEKIASACLDHREAILELESLITTRDVCDPSKIDALIEYHDKYFKSKRHIFIGPRKRKPITHRFFSKYAIQVAYTCKKNLLRNLEQSRDELQARGKVFDEARERIYREDPSIKSNIKLIQEQANEPVATNVKPRDDVEQNINEYRVALIKLKRPEDILTFDRSQCVRSRHRKINISKDRVQTFFKPAMMCLELARYYSGCVLSIAKLANSGYMALDDELDVKLADSQLTKDWLIAAQVCEPMLYMSTEKVVDEVAIIDTCSERVTAIETMGYDDSFDELDNDMLEQMLPKSEATRQGAQKIMKSAMKKMAKANLMELLKSGKIKKRSIFMKGLKILSASETNSLATIQRDMSLPNSRLTGQLKDRCAIDLTLLHEQSSGRSADEQSFDELMRVLSDNAMSANNQHQKKSDANDDEIAVGVYMPSTIIVIVLMQTFEWLFFIVMTLVARVCYRLNFNFENMLTFPPKVLSWSDADFVKFTQKLDNIDEDDFFDYDELNPEERKQRDLLAKIFGRPPPMLFRE